MRSNPFVAIFILTLFLLVIDFYAYRGVKKLTAPSTITLKRIIFYLFWIVPVGIVLGLVLFNIYRNDIPASDMRFYVHFISGAAILFYVPKLVFIIFNLFDDLVQFIRFLIRKLKREPKPIDTNGNKITRKQFLTKVGIVTAGIPFLSIGYGIGWGRFNFTIRNHELTFAKLPKSFDGLRVLQISDFHIGSFANSKDEVETAIELINEQNADIILFTGDFVNNLSSEVDDFIPLLSKLKAKMGMYSILGNHDYGDYFRWNSEADKEVNLQRLISLQNKVGFKMLLNESLKISNGKDEFELVGVENWGLPPFPQYGDLNKALANTNEDSFKILMSHDPSHWGKEVLQKSNVDLTLSGHTHGAQFGIEIPGWRWSPVTIRYDHWGGIYNEGEQFLNVNTGIGFIGFPGRVGMPPEITVFDLKSA